MIAFAYTECGLSIERFFRLSWYEWSLEIEKVSNRRKRDFEIWEGQASLFRNLMATVMNSSGKSYKKHIDAKDLMRLSFDKDEQEIEKDVTKLTPEQVEQLHPKELPKLKKLGK